jgi:hypothetical protein
MVVVRGSACRAAIWTSRRGTPASSAAMMNAARSMCSALKRNTPSSDRSRPRASEGWTCGRRTYWAGSTRSVRRCERIGRSRTLWRAAGQSLTLPDRVGPARRGTSRCADGSPPASGPRCRLPTGRSPAGRGGRPQGSDRCSGPGTPPRQAEHHRPGTRALAAGSSDVRPPGGRGMQGRRSAVFARAVRRSFDLWRR